MKNKILIILMYLNMLFCYGEVKDTEKKSDITIKFYYNESVYILQRTEQDVMEHSEIECEFSYDEIEKIYPIEKVLEQTPVFSDFKYVDILEKTMIINCVCVINKGEQVIRFAYGENKILNILYNGKLTDPNKVYYDFFNAIKEYVLKKNVGI